jgi:molybdate transport system ATP-binding protein
VSLVVDATVQRGGFAVAVAWEAAAGETVALLGPNGAGKSTVVALLAGLVRPVRGGVWLDGEVLDGGGVHLPPDRRDVGVVFQDLLLFPHLRAVDNAAFPLRAAGTRRGEARRAALDVLADLGVARRASARPGELSGGEAQRVALARALLRRPRLLVLDEPLSALDVGARSEVRRLLGRVLGAFPGVKVLVTHDPTEAATLADRIVVLEGGRMTQTGTPEEIRRRPRTRYAADLVGVNLLTGRLAGASGDVRLAGEGWSLAVTGPAGMAGEAITAVVRPADIVVHTARPEGGSARNVLAGLVQEVAVAGDRARVRLASRPPLVAEVTVASVERLGIRPGIEAWASFKAVEVEILD